MHDYNLVSHSLSGCTFHIPEKKKGGGGRGREKAIVKNKEINKEKWEGTEGLKKNQPSANPTFPM